MAGIDPINDDVFAGLNPPYRTLVIDPPWRFKNTLVVTGNAPGRTPQAGRSKADYATMSIEEVAALPVADLAHPDGAHLYLWTTNTHLEHAWSIIREWGFTFKNVLTWAKAPKGMIGFGAYSPATEFCVFAATGKRSITIERQPSTWYQWPRRAHSEKPAEFYGMVERVSPGPRVDIFARKHRDGWDVWGDQVPEPEGLIL